MHLSSQWFGCCPFYDSGSVVVDLLFNVAPIVCVSSVFGSCFVIQYFVASSFAIILMGERWLLYFDCLLDVL